MGAGRILWVGDNHKMLKSVLSCIKDAGYEIATAEDELQGLGQLYNKRPDLIIIDGALMGEDNNDPYLRLRESSYTPIIILSNHESQGVRLLELGADSFMKTPPDPRELKARIDSMVNRKHRFDPPTGNGGASGDGQGSTNATKLDSNLTPTEHRISNCLEMNKGQVVEYSSLLKQVWGAKRISLDTLHYYIRRLKAKLSYGGITQLRGVGYFMA
jgi:DNA-binding response OmpR family regulator